MKIKRAKTAPEIHSMAGKVMCWFFFLGTLNEEVGLDKCLTDSRVNQSLNTFLCMLEHAAHH